MKGYADLSGTSGVLAYELHDDAIDVKFADGGVYRYSRVRPGSEHVREMQRLARAGTGLATYINQHVRDNFESKLR